MIDRRATSCMKSLLAAGFVAVGLAIAAAPAIAKLRMKKSQAEIALVQQATDVGMEAHRTAWKRIKPGLMEYQVAAAMSNVYFDHGCERHAYIPIVGSGPNAARTSARPWARTPRHPRPPGMAARGSPRIRSREVLLGRVAGGPVSVTQPV